MRVFLLHKGSRSTDRSLTLLHQACDQLSLESVLIDTETFDFTQEKNLPSSEDAVYRIADGFLARAVEKFLLKNNPATLYRTAEQPYFFPDDIALYHQYDLQIPKTIPALTKDPHLLKQAAHFVGGYPLVLKVLGKSHGAGLFKVSSEEELLTLVEPLIREKKEVVMKEFIPHKKHARLIVLGGEVIDSIAYLASPDDFRTNAGTDIRVIPEKFSAEIEALAIKAVHISGWEFGGVDVIIHEETGRPYLAEVNFPCFFPRAEAITKTPIAEKIILYLQKKIA